MASLHFFSHGTTHSILHPQFPIRPAIVQHNKYTLRMWKCKSGLSLRPSSTVNSHDANANFHGANVFDGESVLCEEVEVVKPVQEAQPKSLSGPSFDALSRHPFQNQDRSSSSLFYHNTTISDCPSHLSSWRTRSRDRSGICRGGK